MGLGGWFGVWGFRGSGFRVKDLGFRGLGLLYSIIKAYGIVKHKEPRGILFSSVLFCAVMSALQSATQKCKVKRKTGGILNPKP